jgi:hypothetical protein
MRMPVVFLIVLVAVYIWDVNFNNGVLSDGAIRMFHSMSHSIR